MSILFKIHFYDSKILSYIKYYILLHVATYSIFINAIISLSKNNFEITIGLTIVINILCYIFTYIFRWSCSISIRVLRQQDALNHYMFS